VAGPAWLIDRLRRVRPWPSPDDVPWRDSRLCVVDIETTGLDLARDEVVSIGVAEVAGGRVTSSRFYQVVRPERPISEASMRVHALTATELADAPSFGEVLPRLRAFIGEAVIVAHAAWIERAFLDRALRPYGERVPDRLVDTAALARHLGLAAPGPTEPSLELLCQQLGLPAYLPHHALGDAVTTAQLLLVLASRIEAAEPSAVTVGRLLALSSAAPTT